MADLEALTAEHEAAAHEAAIAHWDLIEGVREAHRDGASLADLIRRTGLSSPAIMSALTCQSTNPLLAVHSPEF